MSGQWLDDAFGPDGIRVTFRVEEAADRLIRAADDVGLFSGTQLLRSLSASVDEGFQSTVEDVVSGGRWNLLVEADSGRKSRVSLGSRDEALALGDRICAAVRSRGVAGMDDLPG